jgi:MoaA/NifB/PqqE/SkfB family radical SAM enzyme
MLAGGEPTLHRELCPIVRLLGANCGDVTLFTNGLRLEDPAFARAVVLAGVTRFEIALFGASAERHDAVTRLPGSFERTLRALRVLIALRESVEFNSRSSSGCSSRDTRPRRTRRSSASWTSRLPTSTRSASTG